MLKRVAKEVLSTLVIFFIIAQVVNFIRKPEIKSDIYGYDLVDINHKTIDFHAYKGKPLIVHFWATWCPTCKLEASNIETISQKYNTLTIAVNSGSDEVLKAYMNEHHLSYPVVNDSSGTLAQAFNIEAYPTTLIYNAKGALTFSEVGYTTTLGLQARLELIQ
jgi:thiol-disulfide isomerase/thioredoxin